MISTAVHVGPSGGRQLRPTMFYSISFLSPSNYPLIISTVRCPDFPLQGPCGSSEYHLCHPQPLLVSDPKLLMLLSLCVLSLAERRDRERRKDEDRCHPYPLMDVLYPRGPQLPRHTGRGCSQVLVPWLSSDYARLGLCSFSTLRIGTSFPMNTVGSPKGDRNGKNWGAEPWTTLLTAAPNSL